MFGEPDEELHVPRFGLGWIVRGVCIALVGVVVTFEFVAGFQVRTCTVQSVKGDCEVVATCTDQTAVHGTFRVPMGKNSSRCGKIGETAISSPMWGTATRDELRTQEPLSFYKWSILAVGVGLVGFWVASKLDPAAPLRRIPM